MWQKHKTSILLAISFLFVLSAFWLLPQLAFVVFIALLIDLLLHPLVDHLHRVRYIPRSIGAALSLILSSLRKDDEVLLLAGVANPSPFIEEMKKHSQNVNVMSFGDHHDFKKKDVKKISTSFGAEIEERRVGKECRSRWSPYH